MLEALVPPPPLQKTMDESLAPLLHQRCHHHHQPQAMEEYVLDERDFGHFRPLSMATALDGRRGTAVQQQRHVRRSTELRTVSIIETLSELVAGQSEGGKLDDCDGQCQRRIRRTRTHKGDGSPPEVSCPASSSSSSSCSCSCSCRLGGNPVTAKVKMLTKSNDRSLGKSSRSCGGKDRTSGGVSNGVDANDFCKDRTSGKSQAGGKDRTSNGNEGRTPAKLPCPGKDRTLGKMQNCGKDRMAGGAGASNGVDAGDFRNERTLGKLLSPGKDRTMMAKTAQTSGSRNCQRSAEDCSGQCIHGSLRWPTTSGANCEEADAAKKCPAKKGQGQAANARSEEAAKNQGPSCQKQCGRANHDPAHFMLSTLRSKGRTPDWIAGIFSIARRGNLERLSQALVGMDATLIRNLSDHRGNNLFHVCCCYGHLDSLQWLMQRGKQCEDAILDENKYELTPLVCAVKYGKLPCVEWLIQNTIARGQLVPSNGTRPLLHWAAKYGQEVILRWLAEYMEHNSMDVNVKDGHGNTALHLAAKHGHAVSIKALVIHRCDASLKNDIGYKATDYALLYGQTACSEYLLSLEACLLLSSDVATLDADIYSSRAEMSETKIQFKDVLSCAKKLVKEREELSQHLDRLQDGLVHLNDVIVFSIQGLYEENCRLREKVDGRRQCANPQSIDETIALCHAMQTRWKDGQQRWLSPAALGEIQQKILLAEERWKRARVRATWENKESKEHVDVFRERLAQVQCRATGIRLSEIRSISSSESSLASMEDTMSEYEERYEMCGNAEPLSPRLFGNGNALGQQRGRSPPLLLRHEDSSSSQVHCGRLALQQFAYKTANLGITRNSGYSSDSVPSKSVAPQKPKSKVAPPPPPPSSFISKGTSGVGLVSQGTCKVLEVIVNSSHDIHCGQEAETVFRELEPPWTVDAFSETGLLEQVSNLKMYPKSCANDPPQTKRTTTTAGRGHCKAELLECQGKNGGGGDDEGKRRNAARRSARDRGNAEKKRSGSCGGSETRGQSNEGNLDERQQDRETQEAPNELSELFEEFRIVTPTETRDKSPTAENNGKLVSSEPDLIIGTKGIRRSEADIPEVLTADGVEPDLADAEGLCGNDSLDAKDESGLLEAAEFGSATELRLLDIDADENCVGLVACGNGNPVKRRGFLQKLNLRWPSKRKVANSSKKVHEISPENFRETYLHVRNGPGEDGDTIAARPPDASPSCPESEDAAEPRDDAVAVNKDGGGFQSPLRETVVSASSSSLCSLAAVSYVETNAEETASTIAAGSSHPPENLQKTCQPGDTAESSERPRKFQTLQRTFQKTPADESGSESMRHSPDSLRATFQKTPSGSCAADDFAESASQGRSERSNSYAPKKFQSAAEGIPAAPTGPRNIPVPPLPVDLDLESQNDPESQNGYSYIRHQSLGESSRDEDEEDGDEEHEDSSRPEADQDIPRDEGLEMDMADDKSNLIHAQASMPPQRPLSCGNAKAEHGGGGGFLSRQESSGFLSRPESSGFLSRPESSCFLSRPESSVSRAESYSAVFRLPGYPLRKASSVSTDLLTPDSLTPSRMSPAPSEVSKTESALSPPSDISKTESVRHMRQLTRIEERGKAAPALPLERLAEVKVAAIVDINPPTADEKQPQDAKPAVANLAGRIKATDVADRGRGTEAKDKISVPDVSNVVVEKSVVKEKPWYELSDDEEILMPETLRRGVGIAKSSSEEDEAYLCA